MRIRGVIWTSPRVAILLVHVTFVRAALLALLTGILCAHITIRTDNNKAGGHAVYSIRVPNESETSSTSRIEVRIPESLAASRYEPKSGWEIALTDGVLTADGGAIRAGQFTEFRFQAQNPRQAGVLKFAATQTYDDGEIVDWTGSPGSETPAPVVEIVAASPGEPEGTAHPHPH